MALIETIQNMSCSRIFVVQQGQFFFSPRPGAHLGTLTAHAVVASGGGDELHMRVRASALKSPRLMGTPSPYLAVHRVDPMDGERL